MSNDSSIFLFNILYVFTFIRMMYFEYKQFEENKTMVRHRQAGNKIISHGWWLCKTSIQSMQVC